MHILKCAVDPPKADGQRDDERAKNIRLLGSGGPRRQRQRAYAQRHAPPAAGEAFFVPASSDAHGTAGAGSLAVILSHSLAVILSEAEESLREGNERVRTILKSKIHRATVTQADLHYEGSITIDPVLLEAADIVAFEQVHVLDVDNGSRLTTYAIEGARGSGRSASTAPLHGSSARRHRHHPHVHDGDGRRGPQRGAGARLRRREEPHRTHRQSHRTGARRLTGRGTNVCPGGIMTRISTTDIRQMKQRGEKIVMMTAYDYPTARLVEQARRRHHARRRHAGHGRARLRLHAAGDDGGHDPSHAGRRARHGARAGRRRHAVHELSDRLAGRDAQRRRASCRRRAAGAVKLEGGVRVGRDRAEARRGRHPGDGPHRPDAAVGEPVRRLQGAGQDAGRRRRS